MVLEEILTRLTMWFFYALIPCLLLDGVAVLPAPQNLSVHSTNMKHLLMWSPVFVPGELIHYFVEYQGEYESLYMSHIWIPSSWCSPTKSPECDITDDITATVPYSLRVRATQSSETSAWSTLKHPFNRNSTILNPPVMEVTKDGFHLVIKLEDLGPQFEFLVAYWRREPGAKGVTVFWSPKGTCQSGEEQGHSSAPGNHATGGCLLCEGPDIREGHREAQPFQPGRMCQGARRDPPTGAGPVCVCWLHADPRGGAHFDLENGPAAPALLLPRGGAPRHLENNQFTPEVNQLQEGRGGSLCHCHAVFGGALQDLDLGGFARPQLKLRSWWAWHWNHEGKGCGSVFPHGQMTRKASRACWVHV
ncbi:interleukin-20 receptor subunit beta isoform X1 [Hyaena hyaena]|uniref:interleukin-20 receptor subunit beta isoform X1 n=2 Tax=Hyaena hyaena TaxID=95912 RepID=UPI00192064BE|nr:interleukin-20 receptor subunit beta isoform X1 [Hyaena hyaena]